MQENNDRAKKILFGKTDIEKLKDIAFYGVEKGEGVEYNFTNEERPKTQSQWIDPEMTGGNINLGDFKALTEIFKKEHSKRDYFVWDNKTGESRKATEDEIGQPVTVKLDATAFQKPDEDIIRDDEDYKVIITTESCTIIAKSQKAKDELMKTLKIMDENK